VNFALSTVVIIVVAMSVGGFIKGATGQGLPTIAIPVIATFLGVEAAVVVMAIPGITTNTWLLWNHREHFRVTRDLPALLVFGTIGAVAGTALLETLDDDLLSLALASVIVAYVVVFFTHPQFSLPAGLTRYLSPPVGLAAGVLQGATGISGPLVATYLHSYRLDKAAYVLSITTVFQVYAVIQAVTLAGVGLYSADRLVLSLLALLPTMTMLPLGARFTHRLSREVFDLVVLALLVASAVKLTYDGLL
jgi:uncharacterized membrane protein YfcA